MQAIAQAGAGIVDKATKMKRNPISIATHYEVCPCIAVPSSTLIVKDDAQALEHLSHVSWLQMVLSEMLNRAGAPTACDGPNNKRLGCHMALFSALLKAETLGPLTV